MQIRNYKLGTRDTFFVITIIILVIVLMFKSCNDKTEAVTKTRNLYKYKTDTVYVNSEYKDKYQNLVKYYSRKGKQTPPKTITVWKTLNPENILIEKVPDSILVIIDSLNQMLAISDAYIKNFPKNDKLVNFGLKLDSLNITTINIEGETKTKDYPLYLDRFGYQWYDNELHHYDVKQKGKLKNKFNQFYINGGYDFLYQKPTIGLEYFMILGKFKLGANSNLILQPETKINLGLNLGYRLF